MDFQDTNLFRRTLGDEFVGDASSSVAFLRDAFLGFRNRAAVLAAEIPQDLRELTVHDVTHLDALWEMAGMIAGPEYPLTPVEAFVLGGAFLVHDLGLSLAAWPKGKATLKADPAWKDLIVQRLRKYLGRYPTSRELENPPDDLEHEATMQLLLSRHAQLAEQLVLRSWQDPGGGPAYFLLDDTTLRDNLGAIIGKIACSHWWPFSRVESEFGHPTGALGMFPQSWTLDPLRLALLLRTADATQIDSRRSPGFLRAIRVPGGESREHWLFQEHLAKPIIQGDRFIFTTTKPFERAEAAAWWRCREALYLANSELHRADSLLSDTQRPRFSIRGVAGVDSVQQLQKYIRSNGWTPIDAQLHVSDVASLVERLGGRQLYGYQPLVPLRELIQNAADAVRARRLLEARPGDWGHITVRLGSSEDDPWLEVEDNGLGMSEEVLCGTLLDFGTSYWASELMLKEAEGLLANGFEPTGRYGIGFFSVFMLGDRINVTSRRFDSSKVATNVLEFKFGVKERPLMRPAEPSERLQDGGTRVRIWLRSAPTQNGGFLYDWQTSAGIDLSRVCAWLAPALDVDLFVETGPARKLVVRARDWIEIKGVDLLKRLNDPTSMLHVSRKDLTVVARNLRLIRDDRGQVLGRAALSARETDAQVPSLIITVGGLKSASVPYLAGILVGECDDIKRDSAFPLADHRSLRAFASEQAKLIGETLPEHHQLECAAYVLAFGGEVHDLPIAKMCGRCLRFGDIASWSDAPKEILVISDDHLGQLFVDEALSSITLRPNVLIVPQVSLLPLPRQKSARPSAQGSEFDLAQYRALMKEPRYSFALDLRREVVKALAHAWGANIDSVYEVSLAGDNKGPRRVIGTGAGRRITVVTDVIRDPKKFHSSK